jgi:fluoroacetyl-CoA thioesterase
MSHMPEIPIGAKGEHKLLVTGEYAIRFLGPEDARVLGTPSLVFWMEVTCRNLIKQYLDPGFDTVGTELNVKHLAATPMGMQATFIAEILQVTDRRVLCRVEAFDEKEKIGEGTHERFIINVDRFAARLKAKRDGS